MAEKNNANIGFEKQIWDAACVLWGHIPAAEYRKVIIGLIFLRYISSAFERKYNELVAEGEGFEEDRDEYLGENIFFVPEKARWSTVAAAAHTPEIGTVLDEAMREIEAENKSLKNVLPKNYASPDLDKRVLGDVVDLFTNMDMSDTEEGKDLLGRTYEYCIAQFAAYEGVKGGEFYTPSSIVKTIVAILKPFNNCRVYDPCCGSGGMFVQSVKFIQAHSGNRQSISVYGQESNADTWKMAKMNMAIRGIDADFGPYQADTFFNDLHANLRADFIMANPPFNLSNWGQDKLLDDVRWKYGTPPAGNANYAWIQHMIHHLAPNGKIGLVLANGALSTQSSGEGEIRKNIINADLVEGIVALPTQLFYSVTIPVTLWFISKNKKQKGKTLFIDARKMGYMVDRKHRDFTDEDIQKLADTFEAFQNGTLEDVKGFCAVADLQTIEKQDYILTPGRYVGIEEQEEDSEPFDEKMARLTSELSDMFAKSHELEAEIRKKLGAIMKYKLSEIMDLIGGGTPKTTKPEYWDGDIPWLSVKDFNNDFRFVYETEKHITELGLNNSSTKLLQAGDIIISARGTVGEIATIPFPMAFNQSCYGLRAKKEIVTADFLYYLIKHNIHVLKKNTHGSVFDTITRDTFAGIEVDIPDMDSQSKIAEILSNIDEKIEVNVRINENLAA